MPQAPALKLSEGLLQVSILFVVLASLRTKQSPGHFRVHQVRPPRPGQWESPWKVHLQTWPGGAQTGEAVGTAARLGRWARRLRTVVKNLSASLKHEGP